MATKSFTNDITFEPKDVDNLIKALETDKKPNPIKSIKVKTITEPSEILKLVGLKRDEVQKDFWLFVKSGGGKCYFNHHKNKILEPLKNKNSTPLTYSITCKNGRYYLHCTFEYGLEDKNLFLTKKVTEQQEQISTKDTISETDKNANLIGTDILKYCFGKDNKTKSDLKTSEILK